MLKDLAGKNVYIAGPMTGIEGYNRTEFMRAYLSLRFHVLGLLNPALLPTTLRSNGDYMKICLPMVEASDACVFLPGWRNSRGATTEYHHARQHGLPCYDVEIKRKGSPVVTLISDDCTK